MPNRATNIPKTAAHTKKEVMKGISQGFPIAIGYFSASLAFGLLAGNGGLTFFETIFFSISNFAGASQFMAINLITAGASLGEVFIAVLMINLRYFLMSASIKERISFNAPWQVPFAAFGNTDENFSVASAESSAQAETGGNGKIKPVYLFSLQLTSYSGWVLGTLTGFLGGIFLPEALRMSMGGALYALFAALLVPEIKKGMFPLFIAALAAVLNCLFVLVAGLSEGWGFVLSMSLAALTGAAIKSRTPSNQEQE